MDKSILMQLQNVTKTYVLGEIKVEALKETNLDIYQGEILVILGPSGSGKSTLLNLIGGMDKPSTGDIFFLDRNLSHASDRDLTLFRRREIGFVFQFYNLVSDLTARENVALAASLVSKPLDNREVLDQVGLADRGDHFPSQLSGGEQQRVSIARAIVKNPTLLLCDEPTGALDYQTGISILELLKQARQTMGSTVILVTHNTAIGAMADRMVRMRSGSVADIIINESPVPPERIEW
jgi:putative ABC transport system ATP-binding protein